MLQQQAGGAFEFDAGLLVGCLGRHQVGLIGRQGSGILQDCGLRGESDFKFLLIGVEGLACQVDGRLCGFDRSAVLFHIELCVANLDANLILELNLAYLGLPIFKLGANLIGLRQAVQDGNDEREANALVGRSAIHQLAEVVGVAYRGAGAERRWRLGRIETEAAGGGGAVGDERIDVTPNAGASVIGEGLKRG